MGNIAPPSLSPYRDVEVLPNTWYLSDQGIRFRIVGEWDFLFGTDGWISGELEIRDHGVQSRGIGQVNMLSSRRIYSWPVRFWRWLTGQASREEMKRAERVGLYHSAKATALEKENGHGEPTVN